MFKIFKRISDSIKGSTEVKSGHRLYCQRAVATTLEEHLNLRRYLEQLHLLFNNEWSMTSDINGPRMVLDYIEIFCTDEEFTMIKLKFSV